MMALGNTLPGIIMGVLTAMASTLVIFMVMDKMRQGASDAIHFTLHVCPFHCPGGVQCWDTVQPLVRIN